MTDFSGLSLVLVIIGVCACVGGLTALARLPAGLGGYVGLACLFMAGGGFLIGVGASL